MCIRDSIETIGDGDHSIYRGSRFETPQKWEIPPGQYLMLGDNRDKSADSRQWGLATQDKIVGKAVAIWLHKEPGMSLPNFERNRWFD